jgi:hypothetical protein
VVIRGLIYLKRKKKKMRFVLGISIRRCMRVFVSSNKSIASQSYNEWRWESCMLSFFSSFVHKRKVLVVVLQGTKEWRKRTSDKQSSNSKDSEKKLGKYVISNWLRIE